MISHLVSAVDPCRPRSYLSLSVGKHIKTAIVRSNQRTQGAPVPTLFDIPGRTTKSWPRWAISQNYPARCTISDMICPQPQHPSTRYNRVCMPTQYCFGVKIYIREHPKLSLLGKLQLTTTCSAFTATPALHIMSGYHLPQAVSSHNQNYHKPPSLTLDGIFRGR
jgi:hypothetical protein